MPPEVSEEEASPDAGLLSDYSYKLVVQTTNGHVRTGGDGGGGGGIDPLNLLQGAALLTADCLGAGVLALPADMVVLGRAFGITFLILNLPINLYAGTKLSKSAEIVEADEDCGALRGEVHHESRTSEEHGGGEADYAPSGSVPRYEAFNGMIVNATIGKGPDPQMCFSNVKRTTYESIHEPVAEEGDVFHEEPSSIHDGNEHKIYGEHRDIATFDFIGMTDALFHESSYATRTVMAIYYCNIFLVLGDYILVMSHSVAALVGEDSICIPSAGLLASTLMFAVAQMRTMAKLGRTVSLVSLAALFVVVVQCLVALSSSRDSSKSSSAAVVDEGLIPKFSALASIGFATGSQKLFLNIRHEMKHREEAPKALALSLTFYVGFYVFICIMAGPDPPPFLFDAIAPGWQRRVGGFLLWVHVVVSYAINSQAICSSMDRLFFHDMIPNLRDQPALRWIVLTFGMSVSSYFVANAIPFFKDLVSLIGALTSVPLTLLMPAIFYRQATNQFKSSAPPGINTSTPCATKYLKAWWWPNCTLSYALVVFSAVFTLLGLVGAVSEIGLDWKNHGPPFSCH